MVEKIISFIVSLILIGWNVVDLASGRGGVLSWVALGLISLIAVGEAVGIARAGKQKAAARIL